MKNKLLSAILITGLSGITATIWKWDLVSGVAGMIILK